MRDAGIGQQAFDVALHQREDVAAGDRQDGNRPHDRLPIRNDGLKNHGEDTGECDHRGGLGANRHESRDWSRRTNIYIRRPGLKWHSRYFEGKAHDEQAHANKQEYWRLAMRKGTRWTRSVCRNMTGQKTVDASE